MSKSLGFHIFDKVEANISGPKRRHLIDRKGRAVSCQLWYDCTNYAYRAEIVGAVYNRVHNQAYLTISGLNRELRNARKLNAA